jgi:hypothetical protein
MISSRLLTCAWQVGGGRVRLGMWRWRTAGMPNGTWAWREDLEVSRNIMSSFVRRVSYVQLILLLSNHSSLAYLYHEHIKQCHSLTLLNQRFPANTTNVQTCVQHSHSSSNSHSHTSSSIQAQTLGLATGFYLVAFSLRPSIESSSEGLPLSLRS